MKNDKVKGKIEVTMMVLLIGCMLLTTACAPIPATEGAKIDIVTSIMLNERDTDSPIQYRGIADETVYGKDKSSLYDDLYEYILDPNGYIIKASRTHDKKTDIYSATSENLDDWKTRALSLHQRNLGKWLKGDASVSKKQDPMGITTFEITETLYGNPTGRKTYVDFSKGGALIGIVSVNLPVSEAALAQETVISEERAAEIAFADLLKQYGDKLENKELSEVQWTALKETIQQNLVWTITIDKLTRTDLPLEIKDRWGVQFRVDVMTGEIVERAYCS